MSRTAPQPGTERQRPGPGGQPGFTLIELITVVVILAVISAVALASLSNTSSSRSAVAARQVLRDLSYARERAIATGIRTWVSFSTATSSYSVLTEIIGNPGRSHAVVLPDPSGQGSYIQTLNVNQFAGIALTGAAFDSSAQIGFTWIGQPLNGAETNLAAPGVVTLTGGRTVTVQVGTGLATVP
jgi:prepilin-type N-terminal cleavage/methylation domain-containing protein